MHVVAVLNDGVELEEIYVISRGLSVHTERPLRLTTRRTMTQTQVAQNKLVHKVRSLKHYVGSTPLVQIPALSTRRVKVLAKAEWLQIGNSIKARAAYGIVRSAIETGELDEGKSLLDASSGNTAIAYGALLLELGLKTTICLPSNASLRRIETLRNLGVELVMTSPFEGTEGAQDRARQMEAAHPEQFFYADQYSNPANWQAHYHGTALEIIEQTRGKLTHFVSGLGTTGTFIGTGRRLRERTDCRLVALQPDGPMHIMEGWKHLETADIPAIYDAGVADQVIEISSEETYDMIRYIDKMDGMRLSPSAAANLVGAKKVADTLDEGIVVTVLPDGIERYEEIEKELFDA